MIGVFLALNMFAAAGIPVVTPSSREIVFDASASREIVFEKGG